MSDHEKNAPTAAAAPPAKTARATPPWGANAVAPRVVGVLAGHFLLGGFGATTSLAGKTTLSTDQLDSTIATYTYNGTAHPVTAREVIEQTVTVANGANEDGTYNVPAASDVVSYAQQQVLLADAAVRGLSVSDDELDSFANDMFGSSDYAEIASQYGIDEETAKATLRDSALLNKLRDAVVTTTLPESAPTAPTEPEEGQEDVATADYASYIIGLLGDEWDSENGTWARSDGDYYGTLSSYEITNDSATYAAAQAAYQVAYNKYSEAYTQMSQEWSDYTRSTLSNASIQVGSLTA